MNWIQKFEDMGIMIQNSHIVYTSGKHGSAYFNKDAIYPYTSITSAMCEELAQRFKGHHVEVVAAPAIGAVILGQWIAYHLSRLENRTILSVYAEKKESGGFHFKRGYDELLKGKKTLVVEDVLNTGGSVIDVLNALKPLTDNVVGVAAICNRGQVTASKLAVPKLESLVSLNLEAFTPAECPYCQKGVPFNTSVGKSKKETL